MGQDTSKGGHTNARRIDYIRRPASETKRRRSTAPALSFMVDNTKGQKKPVGLHTQNLRAFSFNRIL